MNNDKKYYEDFCKNHQLPIFYQPWWLDCLAGENNWDVAIYKKSNEIFGVLPYYQKNKVIPVTTILLLIGIFWYLVAIPMNSEKVSRQFKNLSTSEHVQKCWSLKKPKLPTPHQIVTEMVNTTFFKKVSSKRSLVYHGWITLQATLAGFFLGTLFGILLALGIVHNKAMDLSVMPWVIASQTIPILAIAPMIIVVMNSVGVTGLLPKAIISMYLSFFPVVVGLSLIHI